MLCEPILFGGVPRCLFIKYKSVRAERLIEQFYDKHAFALHYSYKLFLLSYKRFVYV